MTPSTYFVYRTMVMGQGIPNVGKGELALLVQRPCGERIFMTRFWDPSGVFSACFQRLFGSPLGPDLAKRLPDFIGSF